jgi:hypothetical protein
MMQAVAGFLVHVNQGIFYPGWWRAPLARMYIINPELDHLVTLLFVTSRKIVKSTKVRHVFFSLH